MSTMIGMFEYTHAVVAEIPAFVKFEDKKLKSDLPVIRKQHEDFLETLKQAGVKPILLPRTEGCSSSSLLVNDSAIVIGGTALLCRPKKEANCRAEMQLILNKLVWNVVDCPEKENGKTVVLEASDVLFTGLEIFVGIRKHGTNMEGAMVVARVFRDRPVVNVPIPNHYPLRYFVNMAADKVFAVGSSKDAQTILKRIEHDATYCYKTITVEEDASAACVLVNHRLIVRQDKPDVKFSSLKNAGLELWALDVSGISKVTQPFSRFCLLFKQTSNA